ncbi:unnamed protein product [Protopolystoma xenopodis]|uniref:LUC7-like protein n=1 Tax=Protopolystoma xenopodis TaxID=117903 RepID=A0A448WGL6_9PLAT|nr:unnamed protein product [Protopolystoma xenopodis]
MGPCDAIHDEKLRDDYQRSKRHQRMGYEQDFVRFLRHLLDDVDKRIRRGHERLAASRSVGNLEPVDAIETREKIEMLTNRINDLLQQAEELGTEGKVDQAQGVLKLCEQLKYERSQLDGGGRPGFGQTKELEVCEICGAFRIKDDAPQRVEEHLSGKMHLGYAKIRDYLREYEQQREHSRYDRERRFARENRDRRSPLSSREFRGREEALNRHRSRHHEPKDDRIKRRSRSRSPYRQRRGRGHSHRSKYETSPFSAPRRLTEGADDL